MLARLRRCSGWHLLKNPKTWTLVTLVAIAIATGFTAQQASTDRGLVEESLWVIEASEQRVAYYEAWLTRGGEQAQNPRDPDFVEHTFQSHAAVPPLIPAIVAVAKHRSPETPTARIASRTNAWMFALFVLLMGLMGLEAGGVFGALTAALGALTIPRIFGLGTVVGFGMAALVVWSLTIYLMHRAARSALATVGATLSIAASIHVGWLGLFVWVPWLYTTLTQPRARPARDGLALTPPLPLRNVAMIPIGLAVGFAAYPYSWYKIKDHVNLWLTHFLRHAAEPFSYAGEVWGHERIPWHAAPFILAVTLPPAFLLLALAGMRFGPRYARWAEMRGMGFLRYLPFAPETERTRRRATLLLPRAPGRDDLLRLARVMLVITLALPLILRSPYHGGIDLIALAVPWVLICAAAGMARLLPLLMDAIPWRAIIVGRAKSGERTYSVGWAATHAVVGTMFVMLLLMPPALEVVRFHPLEEAYYSWLIGGPEGARNRGLPRYPKGPLPMTLLEDVVHDAGSDRLGVGFLLTGRSYNDALHRAILEQMAPPGLVVRDSVYSADVAILPHNDLDPGYEPAATDFYRTVNAQTDYGLIVYERGQVPIFSVAIAPRR